MSIPLFDHFNSVSSKAWKQRIQFELEGRDYNSELIWKSIEGVDVKPFYHRDNTELTPSHHHQSNTWKIGHSIFINNVPKAVKLSLDAINRGADAIHYRVPHSKIELDKLFSALKQYTLELHFELSFLSSEFVSKLNDFSVNTTHEIYIHIDTVGHLAHTGNWYKSLNNDHQKLADCLSKSNALSATIAVNLGLYQNAGASIVQQLAYSVAHANEYLNSFHEQIKNKIVFKVAIGSNFFFEIAKLRALKLVWQSLMQVYENDIGIHITAQPSKRNKTVYDYNSNMLRTTTECMSAIFGGAQTIINSPYDSLYHKDNAFGQRLSINQLLILKYESYLDKVSNPTEGAYYIETLTKDLAQKSLDLFKSIEAQGGFLKQLHSGIIQRKIKAYANKAQTNFDSNNEGLLKTHLHHQPNDQMKSQMELYPFVKYRKRKTLLEPIVEKRLAEQLELQFLKNE